MDDFERIRVRRLSGAGGAEILGVDLSQPLQPEVLVEIKAALQKYLAVGFRDQHITPDQECAFASHWGALTRTPFIETLPEHPNVTAVVQLPDASGKNFGGEWHSDGPVLERPPLGGILYARDVPPYGGDTLFSNLYMAYEALSPGMQKLADSLVVMHSLKGYHSYGSGSITSPNVTAEADEYLKSETPHPLVRINPDTGRKALWITGRYSIRFADMTEAESGPLLDFFRVHAANPNFVFRWQWTKDSLLFWDNRVTNHFAVNDYQGHRREMYRVQVEGERPFGPAVGR
ncbi:MAG: TauD/TfdA dioxygenase family protein [Nitrospira sp.]